MAETKKQSDVKVIGSPNANLSEIERINFDRKKGDTQVTDNRDFAEGKADTPNKGVEQSKSQEEKVDWEKSAKYFQSEKDKLFVENEKIKSDMEKYEALGKFVESRKDIQGAIDNALQGKPIGAEVAKAKDTSPKIPEDFDPWEAYNDTSSESYKYRTTLEQYNIQQAQSESEKKMQQQMAIDKKRNEFDSQLTDLGLNSQEKSQFYDFANKPISQMSTDVLVNMWRAADMKLNTPANQSTPPPEIAVVDANKNIPAPLGVLQGEQPPPRNEDDDMWNRIMGAANKTRII